ncbi:MAG: hypothetical protein Q8L23_12280 [Caulobacter sp.]|nr:hypothetical protein [Caulobacter sp.]
MPLVHLSLALTMLAAGDKPLPAYDAALNCAGVTQAASRFGEGPETAKAFDSAMYWSLAAMEAARANGLSASAAQADQDRARDAYKALLEDDDADAWADLAGCLKATPPTSG